MIVVAEMMWPEGLAVLEGGGAGAEPGAGPGGAAGAGGEAVRYDPDLHRRPGDLAAALAAGARALVVRNRTRVDARLLAAAPALRVVGRLGAGLDNVDVAACRRRGVEVVHAPDANAVSVAEMTLALVLALARRLAPADAHVRGGGWERQAFAGMELDGKTLGILGFGRIGRLVAGRARAFGMRLLTHHPRLSAGDPDLVRLGVELVPLDDLLAGCDVLTVHLPLTPATRNLLDAAALARLRPGAHLVNVGRGGVVDEAALADALEQGRLAGAALDVRASEPPGAGDPVAARLNRLPNVLLTPHVAGLTAEAQRRTCLQVARDVLRVLAGEPPLLPAP